MKHYTVKLRMNGTQSTFGCSYCASEIDMEEGGIRGDERYKAFLRCCRVRGRVSFLDSGLNIDFFAVSLRQFRELRRIFAIWMDGSQFLCLPRRCSNAKTASDESTANPGRKDSGKVELEIAAKG